MGTTTMGHDADQSAGRELIRRLGHLRGRVLARVLGRGVLAATAWLSLAAALALVLQGLFGPKLWIGVTLGVLFLGFAVWILATRLVVPLRHYPILRRFAWIVDRDVLGGGDEVVAAYDLVRQREREPEPLTRALIDHAVAQSLPAVQGIAPRQLDRGPRVLPMVGMLVLAAVTIGLFHAAAPLRLKASWLALLNPMSFPYSPGVTFDVAPGDLTVDTGADVRIVARVIGERGPARLLYQKEGGAWKSLGMATVETNEVSWMGRLGGSQVTVEQKIPETTFRISLPELRRNTAYRVRVGGAESDAFAIRVTTPPRVASYQIETRFPDYAGLADEVTTAPVGTIAALVGSRVTMTPVIEGNAERIDVVFDDGRVETLAPDGVGRRALALDIADRREYRVRLSDRDGRVRFESPSFAIEPVQDLDPVVRVMRPGDDIEVRDSMTVPVSVSCADDFGLTRLLLHVHKEPYDPVEQEIRAFEGRTRESTVEFDWDISSLEMLPGETATYWFELFDNDTVSGPKSARSPIYEIRFPSMAELYSEAEEEYSENVVDAVDDIYRKEQDLKERLETMRQDLERSREGVTWERQKEVEGLMQSAESLHDQLSQAMESMQRSMDRMGESDASNFQILERMEMIQSLLEEVQDERLQAMMDEIRKALEEMDDQKLQEALEAFDFQQDEVLQSLDRAVEHLKQILAEQKLEAALDDLQALLDEQSKINDQLDDEGANADEATGDEGAPTDESTPSDESVGNDDGKQSPADAADEQLANEGAQGENAESQSESAESEASSSEASQGEQAESSSEASESSASSEPSSSDESAESSASENAPSGAEQSPEGLTPEQMEALAQQQDALREQLEELGKSIEELQELAKQSHPMMDQQLQQAAPQQGTSEAGESMESASEAMRQPSQEEALHYGLSAEEQLQSMMNGMMSASGQMQAERNAEASREMMALGAELLHLSDKQEGVVTAPDGRTTRDLAADQMRLFEATGRASEKLHEIGKKTLFVSQSMIRNLGAVLDDMNGATTQLESGNMSRGRRDAQDAMSGLNGAVMDLLRANQQMQQAGGACANPQPNAMSRIPTLSGMQEQLNKQTQALQQQLSRGRLSPQTGSEAMQQLAARQEAIRRGIQEIAEQLAERRDVLGRLDQMGGDLKELVEEMNKGRLTGDIVDRQQKILSRLLAAERSIRQQDQDDQRLARSAKDQERASPSALDEESLGSPDRIEREILQGRTDPFPPRYRRMIEAYFKALGAGERR